jgi:DcrB
MTRSMRFGGVALAAMVMTTVTTLFAEPATAPSGNRVSDSDKHFEFTLPEGWTVEPPNQPNMAIMARSVAEDADDAFLENVNVVIISIPGAGGQVTLEQIVPQALAGMKQQIKVTRQGEVKKTTLGGEAALSVDMTLDVQNTVVESKQTYVLKGDNFYVVTYTSRADTNPATHKAEADLMKSWQFLK